MYFKKLEIVGFKSFTDKTTLYFEPGITAVVGPNGCGKSNIVDSIKWVLGEQSIKSLRGSKMEDVIFNGTDNREPLNMAEVSLTLSNKDRLLSIDANEVEVSRRIFRSGESEYLLNKTPVRLKDINELFMGTGIGAEAYSIIEQGKIDLIISSRPEDRRYIFEEASGITKYKSKKREAARKLEETDSNILRVNDIITEVGRQINSITRQAKKAERYKERFDRLKELEMTLASYESGQLRQEEDNVNGDRAAIKEESDSLLSRIEQLQHAAGSDKRKMSQVDEKYNELQSAKFSKESLLRQSRSMIEVNKERIAEFESRLINLGEEIRGLEARKESSQKLVNTLESELSSVTDSEDAKAQFLREEEAALARLETDIVENEARISEGEQTMVDCMAEKARCKNDLVRFTSDIQNRSLRMRRLRTESEKVDAELAAAEEKKGATAQEFSGAQKRLQNIKTEKDGLLAGKNKTLSNMAACEARLQEERNNLLTLESKKSFLEDMISRLEGLAGGAKAIAAAMRKGELKIDGIFGILGGMVEAKAGYDCALESALGELVQCVVAGTREAAFKASEYLCRNKLGRATFIILDEMPDAPYAEKAQTQPEKAIGRLADFVQAREDLKRALSYLLRGFYLIDGIENAKYALDRLAKDSDAVLVTKKGEVLKKGMVTAGTDSAQEESGIIGRQMRLKETVEDIERSAAAVKKIEKDKDALAAALAERDRKLESVESFLKEEEAEYHKKESLLSAAEADCARLKDEISLVRLETDEIAEEIRDLEAKKSGLEERLKEVDGDESSAHNVLLNSQELVKNYSKEREDIIVLIAKIKTEIQAISREKATLSSNLTAQRDFLEAFSKSLSQKTSEIEESDRKKAELSEENEELEKETIRLSQELKETSHSLDIIGSDKNKTLSSISETESQLNTLGASLAKLKEEEHRLEMRGSEIGFKLETLKNRMAQLYKIDIDAERRQYDASEEWDSLRTEVEDLKMKLESMGTVNLVAIEEHKELEERYNFLTHQREDLTKAKADLEEAITKINKTTRRLFLETFEKIQFEFRNYFRYLFGGGNAEIYLLDEHDVLESGIEIVARPPGKKLQSISLLSGGEKSLTAIALIYAIFKVKPSPFCLLDEVDAALDEANIDRFSKALREFTKTSQFIVITHNKKTITLADVMYGITMEKSGVSKIVSVKFHDEEKGRKLAQEEKVTSSG